jgi:nucleotide-binding universal stress UspA family protein
VLPRVRPSEDEQDQRERVEKELYEWAQRLRVPEERRHLQVTIGQPSQVIVRESGGYDLIVMATHGRSGLEHFWLGSVVERTVRRSACSVLTVKPG